MRGGRSLALLCTVLAVAGPVLAAANPFGGWRDARLTAGGRTLAYAVPPAQPSGPVLTVVIEGDGASHDGRGRPSADPTPWRKAGGLDIARAFPADGPIVWLGRLCQFTLDQDPACRQADWTTGRFSPAAVAAATDAIDQLKARTGAVQVRLVGWSGGGTLAALVAERRTDVEGLITLAAPLDTDTWTAGLGLSPLTGSLNPADGRLAAPQVHLYGAFDAAVPARGQMAAARALAGAGGVVAVRRQRHECCWPRELTFALAALEDQRP